MTSVTGGLRHGHPEVTRNDKWEHDKYVWPGGLELFIYDDGRVKVGRYDASGIVEMVHSMATGVGSAGLRRLAGSGVQGLDDVGRIWPRWPGA